MVRYTLRTGLLLIGVTLAGCQVETAGNTTDTVVNAQQRADADTAPILPAVEAPLTRRDLLLAAVEAASDHAAGVDDRERQRPLDGRLFSFRIRLCEPVNTLGVSSYDVDERVLRVEVRPNITIDTAAVQPLVGERFEAVEGFWVPTPWLLQAACPQRSSAAEPSVADAAASAEPPVAPDEPQMEQSPTVSIPSVTVGLAQFFDPASDRARLRSGRPYNVTKKLAEGTQPGPVDLVLSGRLSRLPESRVINCVSRQAAAPPSCIIAVRIDTVRLEDPSGELLGEWTGA